jgi:hypothetical protein
MKNVKANIKAHPANTKLIDNASTGRARKITEATISNRTICAEKPTIRPTMHMYNNA